MFSLYKVNGGCVLFFIFLIGSGNANASCLKKIKRLREIKEKATRCVEAGMLLERNDLERCRPEELEETIGWCDKSKQFDLAINLQSLVCQKLKRKNVLRKCLNRISVLQRQFSIQVSDGFAVRSPSGGFQAKKRTEPKEKPKGFLFKNKTIVFISDVLPRPDEKYCTLLEARPRLTSRIRLRKDKPSASFRTACRVSSPTKIRIFFRTARAEIRPMSRPLLESLAQVVRTYLVAAGGKRRKLLISGHTDSDGSERTNKWLSMERARAVRLALQKLLEKDLRKLGYKGGTAEAWVHMEGLASRYPVADNETSQGKAQNRRVEFRWISEK